MASQKHQTLVDAIKEDHQEMYEYYDQYVKATGNADAQERWSRQLTWEIARHVTVKEQLNQLESLNSGSKQHGDLLNSIMQHLHEHNDNEEKKDLPLLEPTLGKDGSLAAAANFARTKQFVPTRAHPSAPNQPPFETLAGFMTAPLDKLKDAFAKFPTEEMKANAK
ncbi:hypothetical protein H0H87_008137 [Tephrocybe sp. NHM501043]|nr:hypothetical protein H0H87_008137 [Tephrocybe sp. NHM501043]